ncbi:unnamed protein product [Durusdinium trenchii]|uniref:Uncharacterized protein n=1 Tax=Durusdinium trenchii TaxID=1381693 RepID=A0ABP0PPI2_9DINO
MPTPSNGSLPKDAHSDLKSDAAAAHVLVQCLLGQGVSLEGWKPSKAVSDAITVLAEEARRQLPDVAVGLWPGASEAEAYDEMRDAKGRCRPAYVGVVAQVEQILKSKPKRINDFKEESEKCFKGDNRLYHIPRVLTRQEADTIIAGVAQRAQALRRLVMDVNSRKEMKVGQLSCVRSGALPREVFTRIAARAGEQWAQNLVQKEGFCRSCAGHAMCRLPSFAEAVENSCGGSGPFEDCWNPSCQAEPFAGHGFLAALWRAVCACSCLKLQTFQAIQNCIWLCCPEMGTAPSTVEEPAPMEEQPSFWSSELARQYVLAMTEATQSGQTDWLRQCACCGQASYFRQTVCMNPHCQLSFMRMQPMELRIALQSPPGTPDQMEAKKVERIAKAIAASVPDPRTSSQGTSSQGTTSQDDNAGKWNWHKKSGGGQKRRQWISAVKQGKHPKTGQPLQWRKQWFKDAAGRWKWEWEQVEESKASGTKDSKAPPAKARPVLPPAAKEKAAADKADKAAEEKAAADKAAEEKAAADKAAKEKAAADLKALQEAAAGQAPSTWPPMPSLIVPSSSSSSSAGYGGSSVSLDDIPRFITVFLAAARDAPPRSGPTIIDLTPTLTPWGQDKGNASYASLAQNKESS